jgi:DNA primase
VKFLSEIEKIPFGEALHILAAEAGIEMKTDYNREHGEKTMSFYDMYKVAEHFYHQELLAPQNKDKLAYLTDRGLSDETIRLFKLGYSGNPRDLFYALKSKGYEEKMILESGIFVSPSRDKFFGRIVFPIANYVGNTVAFTGRVLDKSEPKYINSPASDIFDKSSILYGLHLAKSTISKKNHAIIVEGQMDTISLHQAGINEAVGISGTALTKEHIHLLKRLTHNIYLCLDSDEAGTKATFASIENLLNENVNVYVIRVPDGKDPDEFIRNGGDFQACIDQASSLIDFYLDVGTRRTDVSTPEGKKNMVRSLFAILEKIHSRIEIDDYLKRISKRLDIHISALYDELRIGRKNEKALAPDTHKTFTLEERIVGYISHFGYQNLFLENFPYNEFRRAENPFFSFLSTYLENYQERLSES